MNIGELKASISLHTAAFSEGVKKATSGLSQISKSSTKAASSVKKTSSAISNGFKNIGKTAKGLGSSIVVLNQGVELLNTGLMALRQLIGGTASAFIEAASKSEQFRIRIDTALGSVSEGSRLFKEMTKYAAQVPFQFEHIMESATALAPIVEGGVAGVQKQMRMIGDLAALTGLSLREATGNFIKMYSAGAAAADLFRERGILPLLGFLPKVSYGVAETRRKLEESAKMIEGITGRLAMTWDGQVSMMQDKWFLFRKAIMDSGPFNFMKAMLYQLNDQLMGLINNAEDWAPKMGEQITSFLKESVLFIADMIEGAGKAWQSFKPVFDQSTNYISSMWDTFMSLPEWVRELGLIGVFLGGRKGVVVAGGLLHLLKAAGDTAEGIGHVFNGRMNFGDLFNQNRENWNKSLEAARARQEEIEKPYELRFKVSGDQSNLTSGIADALRKAVEKAPSISKMMKLEQTKVKVRKAFDEAFDPAQMKALGKIAKEMDKLTIGNKQGGLSAYEKKIAGINLQYKNLKDTIENAWNSDKPAEFIKEQEKLKAVLQKELELAKDAESKKNLADNIAWIDGQLRAAKNSVKFIKQARIELEQFNSTAHASLENDRIKNYDAMIARIKNMAETTDDSFQAEMKRADRFIESFNEQNRALTWQEEIQVRLAHAERVRAKVNKDAEKQTRALTAQLSSLGKSAYQRGLEKINHRIAELVRRAGYATPEIIKLKEQLIAMNEVENPFTAKQGIIAGLYEVSEALQTQGEIWRDTVADVASSMRDSFNEGFISVIKGDFDNLGKIVENFLDNMLRSMANAISNNMMNQMMGSMSSSGGSGMLGMIASLFTSQQAKGGAWNNGVQFFASGGVVGSPTMFGHSGGLGIMGEAGAEGILPLARMRNGDLGVQASMGVGAPSVKLVVHNNSGQEAEARASEPEWNGQEWVVSLWLDAYHRDAHGLRTGMKTF